MNMYDAELAFDEGDPEGYRTGYARLGPALGAQQLGLSVYELPPGQSALLYSMGFVIATGCLHAAGIGIGTVHRWTWGRKLLRGAGAAIAAGGIVFMWKAFA